MFQLHFFQEKVFEQMLSVLWSTLLLFYVNQYADFEHVIPC